jgi:capsular exopolysaccharide synthesis family protein
MSDTDLDLRHFLAVFWRQRWVIVGVTAVFVALAAMWSLTRTPTYEASTSVLVDLRAVTGQQFGGGQAAATAASEQALRTEIEFLTGDAVTATVEEELGDEVDVEGTPTAGEVFVVTATDGRAARAAAGANAYAHAYLDLRGDDLADRTRGLIRATRDRIAEVQDEIADVEDELAEVAADRSAAGAGDPVLTQAQAQLGSRLNALHVEHNGLSGQVVTLRGQAEAVRESLGRVTSEATVPGSATSPDLTRDLALGLVAGLLAGLGVALARHLLDDRVRTRRGLEALLPGIPVLAALPRFTRRDRRGSGEAVVEAHRGLRAAIEHSRTASPFAVMLLTSPNRGDGTTSVTANLALASAQAGDRVVAVDADVRNRELHRGLGVEGAPGFTDVSSAAELTSALRPAVAVPELRVLPGGQGTSEPARLLSTSRVLPMLSTLQREADLVLLDTPAVLDSSDAETLVGMVDGVLLVVSVGTRAAEVEDAVDALRRAGARFVGAVLNRVADGSRGPVVQPRDPPPEPPPGLVPGSDRGQETASV